MEVRGGDLPLAVEEGYGRRVGAWGLIEQIYCIEMRFGSLSMTGIFHQVSNVNHLKTLGVMSPSQKGVVAAWNIFLIFQPVCHHGSDYASVSPQTGAPRQKMSAGAVPCDKHSDTALQSRELSPEKNGLLRRHMMLWPCRRHQQKVQ